MSDEELVYVATAYDSDRLLAVTAQYCISEKGEREKTRIYHRYGSAQRAELQAILDGIHEAGAHTKQVTICTTADDVLDLVKGTSIPDTETAELVARIQEYSDDALTVILKLAMKNDSKVHHALYLAKDALRHARSGKSSSHDSGK